MEMSAGEAHAQFALALAAAERGERVTITKDGKAVAELGPPTRRRGGVDFDKLERVQRELGIPKPPYPLDEAWRERFDDPGWTRELFGDAIAGDAPDRKP